MALLPWQLCQEWVFLGDNFFVNQKRIGKFLDFIFSNVNKYD
jgi:hypothetical protein